MVSVTLEFLTPDYVYIKQWPYWDGVIPIVGDIVLLHFGDYNEKEEEYKVISRRISGDNTGKITLIIEKQQSNENS